MRGKREYTVALVDEHALFRDVMGSFFEHTEGFTLCFATSDCNQAPALVRERRPDLLLINVTSTNSGGLFLLRQIRNDSVSTKVVAYSQDQHEVAYVERLAALGAQGFFCKTDDAATLVEGLRRIMKGGRYSCPAMAAYGRRKERLGELAKAIAEPVRRLSDREYEVFRHIGWGYPPCDIADRLGIKQKTVGSFIRRIRDKLDIRETMRLQQYAIAYTHCREMVSHEDRYAGDVASGGFRPLCGAPQCCCTAAHNIANPKQWLEGQDSVRAG